MRKTLLVALAAALVLPAGALAGRGDTPPPQKAVDTVALSICTALQSKLGAVFSGRYTSLDACVQAQKAAALDIATTCQSAGKPGSDEFKQCAQEHVKAIVAAAAPEGTANQQKQADQVASNICKGLQGKLGEKFSALFGSVDQCKAKFAATAAKAVSSCASSGKPGSDAYKQCVQAAAKSAVEAQLGAVKANQQKLADKISTSICTALQKKLGDKFGAKFSSFDECKAAFANTAAKAASSCSASSKPGSDAYKDCVQAAVKAAVTKR